MAAKATIAGSWRYYNCGRSLTNQQTVTRRQARKSQALKRPGSPISDCNGDALIGRDMRTPRFSFNRSTENAVVHLRQISALRELPSLYLISSVPDGRSFTDLRSMRMGVSPKSSVSIPKYLVLFDFGAGSITT
jgi:hypothetical protein